MTTSQGMGRAPASVRRVAVALRQCAGLEGRIAPPAWTGRMAAESAGYQIRESCGAAMDACVRLVEAGCLVLGACALPEGVRVQVAPPLAWTGALRKRTKVAETLVARLASGVVVEWRIPRVRVAMAVAEGAHGNATGVEV